MTHDVVIIGAGQAGLATAYYLRSHDLDVVLIDASPQPGGSWPFTWESLRLFSPWHISSLPGWRLPATADYYPTPGEIINYFTAYEQRYGFLVMRGYRVTEVSGHSPFQLTLSSGEQLSARVVINCTGNASRPFVPYVPGARDFSGTMLHSRDYRTAQAFSNRRVAVVGGGNSGAQIAADLAGVARHVTWCTLRPPRFLPDDYDGEALFNVAKQRLAAIERGETDDGGLRALGDIVAVPPVRTARDAGILRSHPMFDRFGSSEIHWANGSSQLIDAVIWCTGFRPALQHLAHVPLQRDQQHHILVQNTQAIGVPGMFFVGYGDWVGPAADTIIGVVPFAKIAAQAAALFLSNPDS
ncbi:ArsO family NAD(P)H-dependent flavin-containing monooxygenase [Corynebacterium epidermidicanis]|uniref:Monooxygenase n=1 Tax=Corynebacterium epidermidicanis TaxID=1050174 RepID=A0A0G3GNV3_9CORY|nr:ArsO family NAD(P)H-dependent flavin-containing monooxygenase [Corynebacterium epidermidicanis]AKK02829.1 monooxygenase [Corynebacterium epidermidicanis]